MAQTPRNFNTYAPGSRGPLEVLIGANWRRVPKVRNVGFTATTPSDSSVEYVDEPTETRSGSSGPGSVAYDLTRAPLFESYRTCYEAFKEGTILSFRDYGGTPTSFSNPASASTDTVEITTAGVVTLKGTLNAGSAAQPLQPWIPGRGLVIAGVGYSIEEVTGAKALRVVRYGDIASGILTPGSKDIDSAVAATADWDIVQYGTRREFTGRVTEMGAFSRGSNNEGQVDRMVVNVQLFPDDVIVVE